MTRIRTATNLDGRAIRELHLHAFPEAERQLVATLATELLQEETIPKTIGLVAELDDAVVGHIAFSPVGIAGCTNRNGYILAPLGISPEHQRCRIGSELIEYGINQLRDDGVNILFVYGDPNYYGRFGFSADVASIYTPPYTLQYPHGWQALVLNEDVAIKSRLSVSCVASLRDPALW